MRYFFLSALFVLGLVACKQTVKGKNGVTYKSASEYNDYIVNRQTELMKKIIEFGKAANISIDSAKGMLQRAVPEVEKMINDIKGMPPYKADSVLRDAAVSSFSFYKRLFEKDYITILDIRKKEPDVTEEDKAEEKRIVDNIAKEEEGLDKAFHNAQREYANKNKMQLMNNKMQKDLEKELDKVNKE